MNETPHSPVEAAASASPPVRVRGRLPTRLLVLIGVAALLLGFLLGRYGPGRPVARQSLGTASAAETPVGPSIDLLPDPASPYPATPQVIIDEATRAVDHLGRRFPDTPDALEVRARLENWLGQSDAAVRTWNECLRRDPKYAYALVGLAMMASKRGDHQQMADLAGRAIELAPENFQARLLRADSLLRLGRPAEVIPVLEDYLNADPRARGHLLLGQAYLELQQYEKARSNYEAAIRRFPEYADAYHGLSLTLSRLGQVDGARQAMEEFRRLSGKEKAAERIRGVAVSDLEITCQEAATLYSDMGRIYFARLLPNEAERLWKRAAALDAKNLSSRQSLAWLCRQLGRIREAAAWLEQAAGLENRPASTWIEIGRLREELLEVEAAEKAYRKAVEVEPANAAGRAALAGMFLRTGRHLPEALELARTAVAVVPTADHYALLAAAYRRNGDLPAAIAAAGKAAELAPEDPALAELKRSLESQTPEAAAPQEPPESPAP